MAEDNTVNHRRIRGAATRVLTSREPWPFWPTASLDAGRWIRLSLAEEVNQRRLFPWLVVCFGLGIVLFFQAEGSPTLWAPLTGLAVSAAAAFAMRRNVAGLAAAIGLAAMFAGFTASVIRARSIDTPVIARITVTAITGFVEAVEDRPKGARLLVRVVEMAGLPPDARPAHIRVTVRSRKDLAAGRYIKATARLLPPPQPAWPGGYDFARDAYFRGIGGIGSLVGPITYPAAPPGGLGLWLAAQVDDARNTLTSRIASAVGGPAGAVAAALVTGKRGLIDDTTNDVLRGAGIYHIVSISGLHMVLAAGTVFWLLRALLALSPAIVLLWPVKKIAAVAAMIAASAYCVFSGSEVATERSLIMTLVIFGAVLVDRPALSIRNLSLAALIVLAREPEALLGPSFQMSFGAVAALIAVAPLMRLPSWHSSGGLLDRAIHWALQGVFGLVGTTLVASIATAPFSAYHFQSLNPFGLIGNALALPLVSFIVMPGAVLGILAYPFGLDRPIWQGIGLAVEKVLDVSAWVSSFDGAALVVPALSVAALILLSLALIVGTLMASRLRWLALIPASAGLALAAAPERFDIYVDRDGAGAAIRGSDGRLALVGKPSKFVVEQWLRADGDAREGNDPSLRQGVRCDRMGCVVDRPDGSSVAYVQEISAFEEDCRRAAIVITRLGAPTHCQASLVLDRAALAARGATAIRLRNGTMEIRSTRRESDPRPWGGASTRTQNRPPQARPTTDQDVPENEVSNDVPG